MVKTVSDNDLIAFYYLSQVGEYAVKIKIKNMKQTVQFKLEYSMFFCQYAKGCLRQLPINSLDEEIFTTDEATLKLDHKKNGQKGVCVYQEHSRDSKLHPVRALGGRCVSIRHQMSNIKTYICQHIGLM